MILGFKKTFPWGEPTHFREKIWASLAHVTEVQVEGTEKTYALSGELEYHPKLHTIREDKHNRWKIGNSIQMVYRGKNYSIENHFNKGFEELQKCVSIQKIKIIWYNFHFKDNPILTGKPSLTPKPMDFITHREPVVEIDSKRFPSGCSQVKTLAQNDGFDSLEQFYKWFNKDFEGKIIHWTDLRY